MKKTIAIIIQVLIFTAAVFVMANTIEDNTYFGSVSYNVDVIAENIRWIMLTAGILSVVNIWFWWPKKVKVANTLSETKESEGTSVKTEEKDPVVPKMD